MQAELPDAGRSRGLFGDPHFVGRVEDGDEDGVAVDDHMGVVRRGHEVHRFPDPCHGLRAALAHRAHSGPAHHRPGGCGARVGEPRAVSFGAEDRLQEVDDDEVREARYGEVGELLSGAQHVQRGADAGAGLVDQGQQLAGVPPLGDVQDHVADAGDRVVGVDEGEERGGVGVLAVRVGPAPSDVLVVGDRDTGLDDLAHQALDGVRLQPGQQFAQPAAQPLPAGYPAEAFQGVVQPDVAQLGVQHGHADRGAGQEAVEEGLAHGPLRALFACRDEEALVGVQPEGGGDPQVRLDAAAVAVPQRDEPAPSLAGPAALRDAGHPYRIAGQSKQACGRGADDL